MDSVTLKGQKARFITSVTKYNEKYEEIEKKIKNISLLLESSDDNLLYDFIRENNEKLIEKINELKSNVEDCKFKTLEKVNYQIAVLEEEERLERERMQKEASEDKYIE